jgi:hypothetical protein
MTPPGQINGANYSWRASDNSLEPIFQFTNPDAVDAQSNDAFLSGIFFGIAGAAAIALLQELPESLSRPSLRFFRKRRVAESGRREEGETGSSPASS